MDRILGVMRIVVFSLAMVLFGCMTRACTTIEEKRSRGDRSIDDFLKLSQENNKKLLNFNVGDIYRGKFADRPHRMWPGGQLNRCLNLSGVSSLTEKESVAISQWYGQVIYLPDLKTIDKSFAENLIKTCSSTLHLCSLKSLDTETAEVISRYRAGGDEVLCLNGLERLDATTAKILLKTKSWGLVLSGLKKLDAETARFFSDFCFAYVELNGITMLDEKTAKEIEAWDTKFMHFDGLVSPSPAVVRSFSKAYFAVLSLNGIRKLTVDVAREFTRFRNCEITDIP